MIFRWFSYPSNGKHQNSVMYIYDLVSPPLLVFNFNFSTFSSNSCHVHSDVSIQTVFLYTRSFGQTHSRHSRRIYPTPLLIFHNHSHHKSISSVTALHFHSTHVSHIQTLPRFFRQFQAFLTKPYPKNRQPTSAQLSWFYSATKKHTMLINQSQ